MGRRIRTIIIFLLAGAVTTVAVAWACAAWVSLVGSTGGARAAPMQGRLWRVVFDCRALGAERLILLGSAGPWIGGEPPVVDEEHLLPAWARRTPPEIDQHAVWLHDGRGLPFHSMHCEFVLRGSELKTLLGGIELPRSLIQGPDPTLLWRALPLWPIWAGFAADSVFYAAMLWLPLRGLRAVRRFMRLNRGMCLVCGYDLRGDRSRACPECGRGA